jgi:hypothetical protein
MQSAVFGNTLLIFSEKIGKNEDFQRCDVDNWVKISDFSQKFDLNKTAINAFSAEISVGGPSVRRRRCPTAKKAMTAGQISDKLFLCSQFRVGVAGRVSSSGKGKVMADVALKDGIAWKAALIASNLKWAQANMPGNKALIDRYQGELNTLKTPNQASYDLVKGNLEGQIESAQHSLNALNGQAAHQEKIFGTPLSEELAAARLLLKHLQDLLKTLELEGRPAQ